MESINEHVLIAAYGLVHPDWSTSVIMTDIKKTHALNVNFVTHVILFNLFFLGFQKKSEHSSTQR